MISDKLKTVSLFAALALAAASMSAQSAFHIVGGEGSVSWPPAASEPMTRVDGDRFHVAITGLGENFRFCFADYSAGGDPARLGPMGDKLMPADENSVYEMIEGNEVTGVVSRSVGSAMDINALDLWTDKARYNPGETVWIQAARFADFNGATVRYRHGLDVIKEEPLRQEWWPWNPPTTDFRGYMVDVYRHDDDGNEVILATIGVDVSSDWKRFPRYGYTAWYEPGKEQWIGGDVAFLNRRHINAVQFQDWHWRHHRPYCGDEIYTDIANRQISLNVIREFIKAQHGYNMMSIFYNLGYGALENDGAAADGVREEWYYYKDPDHQQKDYHGLPADWKSNITFVDPANSDWQNYLCQRNEEVYANLDFDGYQVDQVGGRGVTYDYWGNRFELADRFPSLLNAFKRRHPSKRLIMNSVSNYGAWQIASSGVIDVCYNEMWKDEASFQDLYRAVKVNDNASGKTARTVFACYMNYDFANNGGREFNIPGVLLTDACMFALGAGHLELGTGWNMLCNEYFPNTNLKMSDELQEALTRYYDFNTAYETYLFDTSRELTGAIRPLSDHSLSQWTEYLGPCPRKIVVHAKETLAGQSVYHLLNFMNTNSLSWRDLNADMPSPARQTDIRLQIDTDRMISRAWVASPDVHGGAPVQLPFSQQGRSVVVTVPSLDYWTMLVLE